MFAVCKVLEIPTARLPACASAREFRQQPHGLD